MDNKNDKTNKPTLHTETAKAASTSESGMTNEKLKQAQKPDALPKQTPQGQRPEAGHLGDNKGNLREETEQPPTENATAGDAHGNPVNEPGMSHGARPS